MSHLREMPLLADVNKLVTQYLNYLADDMGDLESDAATAKGRQLVRGYSCCISVVVRAM